MPLDRSEITINGRHIPVTHAKLKLPEDSAAEAASRPSGPRNERELANVLAVLATKVRRIPPEGGHDPHAFHEAKSEIARDLDRLAAWAKRAI